ncbi:hypothetical protein ROA7450_00573 [Roseovarius albus]|uniref:Uncharacterized protein n=1 Tax=Roseovarius albus TaxID=1247867 RepID=A0A1X6YE37_9RHOB|nr:hypothetical protein ROA7450_00573 [Roseovarius albus]
MIMQHAQIRFTYTTRVQPVPVVQSFTCAGGANV